MLVTDLKTHIGFVGTNRQFKVYLRLLEVIANQGEQIADLRGQLERCA